MQNISRRSQIVAFGMAAASVGVMAFGTAAVAAERPEDTRTRIAAGASLTAHLSDAGVMPNVVWPPVPSDAPRAPFAHEYGLDGDAHAAGQMISAIWDVTNIGGYSTGGHVRGSDHYTGNALDVMLLPVTDESIALGWEICDWLVPNAAQLNVKYIIFNGVIWEADEPEKGWQPYSHPTGGTSDAYAHHDHVHISFY